MNFKKALAFILAAEMLLVSFAACTKAPDPGKETIGPADTDPIETDVVETDEPEIPETKFDRTTVSDGLPETTFNGKDFRFIVEERDAYQVYSEDDSGVGLDAEIYARNMRVEERFDIKISYFDSEIQAQDRMVVYCQADEHIAEVCAYPMTMGNTPLVYNCWTNWKNIPYLNFEQPWWNKESIDDFTINGYCYNISGDLSLTSMAMTWCMAFNTNLMEDWGYSADTLYDLVWDGEWTLDKMIEITAPLWADENGDGMKDDGDKYGFGTPVLSETGPYLGDGLEYYGTKYVPWVTAFDEHSIAVNEDKTALVNVLGTEKVYSALEKLVTFHHNTVGAKIDAIDKDFADGHLGMYTTKFNIFYNLTGNMDFTPGVLPMPKYNTDQKDYITCPDQIFTMFGLPSTLPKKDYEMVGVIMEALNAESWKTVLPAYYDAALKGRYSSDATMARMIELIADSRIFEYAPLCIQFIPDYGKLPITVNLLIADNSTDLASVLAEKDERIKEALAGLFIFYDIKSEDGTGEDYADGFSDFDGGEHELD